MSGALATLAGVLASGGASPVVLGDGAISSIGAGSRTATLRLSSDGKIYRGDNGGFIQVRNWLSTGGTASSFEAFCSVNYGLPTGTVGSWLNLGTARDWSITDVVAEGEPEICEINLQIRDASTLTVLASGTWQISADRTS